MVFRKIIVSGFAVPLLVLAACGGGGTAQSGGSQSGLPKTIKVAAILPLSGAQEAVAGTPEKRGLDLAVDQINKSGELHGATVQVDYLDSQSTTPGAVSAMNKVIKDGSYAAVLGPINSPDCAATAPLAQRAKIPYVVIQCGSSDLLQQNNGPNIYRITPLQTSPQLQKLSADYLRHKGIDKVALVVDSSNPSMSEIGTKVLPNLFQQQGSTITKTFTVASNQNDFSAIANEITNSGAQAVGLFVVAAPNATLITQLRQRGFQGQFFSSGNVGGVSLLSTVAQAADGLVWTAQWEPNITTQPSTKQFVDAYSAAYPGTPLTQFIVDGHDAMFLLAKAFGLAKSGSYDDVTAALGEAAKTPLQAGMGTLSFTDRQANSAGVLVEFSKGKAVAAQ